MRGMAVLLVVVVLNVFDFRIIIRAGATADRASAQLRRPTAPPALDGVSMAVAGLISGHASSEGQGDAAAYQAS